VGVKGLRPRVWADGVVVRKVRAWALVEGCAWEGCRSCSVLKAGGGGDGERRVWSWDRMAALRVCSASRVVWRVRVARSFSRRWWSVSGEGGGVRGLGDGRERFCRRWFSRQSCSVHLM